MASGLALPSILPAVACASSLDGRGGRRSVPAARASGSNWWSPLFSWSPEPDYIDAPSADAPEDDGVEKKGRPAARRFSAFTEEKARELRIRMMESEAFHDAMYHSAIASRLASDVPRRRSANNL
ncbi:uncharacterized protein LOC121989898 [Zingiber officinale]|uniref:Uncharacterized protein n=1 Tax=Zingiber officinale TaxID=94328 RepID=A0A8J5G1W2_ZINOF|nr:uncharacterized protein LOC121989898 [Zingiber officinale]KAG6494773.1 hypothetical protein ZIOFF_042534 [Zingiber officinale]